MCFLLGLAQKFTPTAKQALDGALRHSSWWLCEMRGDDDAASTPVSRASQQSGSFAGAGLYWRMAIVAAGPAANFILVLRYLQRFIC